MKVFKISIKFEENGKWSDREVDTEGYLVKKNDDYDMVEGYVKALYPTSSDPIRYIKGLYTNGSLVFMQLCNDSSLSPVCYCFPNINEQGFWSDFNYRLGFFPVYPSYPCSKGHATVCIDKIADDNLSEIEQKTSAMFAEKSSKATSMNRDLMSDAQSLTDFLDNGIVFQMNLHCGKW